MEAEKFKIPVRQGMLSLEGVIRLSYLCKVMGKSVGLIHDKIHGSTIRGFELKFKQKDVDLINSAFQEIGNRLLYSVVSREPSNDPRSYAVGENIAEQIRALSKVISMPYIYRDRMGKTKLWFDNRQKKGGKTSGLYKEWISRRRPSRCPGIPPGTGRSRIRRPRFPCPDTAHARARICIR